MTVDGISAQEPATWNPLLIPLVIGDIPAGGAANNNPNLPERFKQCKEKRDACVAKIKTSGSIGSAAACVKVAEDIKTKRPRWGIIAILAGAACQLAADYMIDKAIEKCDENEMICRATPS